MSLGPAFREGDQQGRGRGRDQGGRRQGPADRAGPLRLRGQLLRGQRGAQVFPQAVRRGRSGFRRPSGQFFDGEFLYFFEGLHISFLSLLRACESRTRKVR